MEVNKKMEYIFTFGYGQAHEDCFHVIEAADLAQAKRRMMERFGNEWAMHYASREEAGVDEFSLRELK